MILDVPYLIIGNCFTTQQLTKSISYFSNFNSLFQNFSSTSTPLVAEPVLAVVVILGKRIRSVIMLLFVVLEVLSVVE